MIDLSMSSFHSSLAQLLQSNVEEVAEAPTSLFELINAHKSSSDGYVNKEVETLSDLASKALILKEDDGCDCIASSPSTVNELGTDETSDFNTLAEYTKSFLSNNSRSTFLSQKPLKEFDPTNNESVTKETDSANTLKKYARSLLNDNCRNTSQNSRKELVARETDVNTVYEKLSNIKISDSSQNEMRGIDLTAALLDSTQNTSTPIPHDSVTRSTDRVLYPVRECIIDISALADEDILYSNNNLSHFGYVIDKKWNHCSLPKKYQKIGRSKPYNLRQAFRFDTPSPDDLASTARNRTKSGSKD